jgi:hypothetical protein
MAHNFLPFAIVLALHLVGRKSLSLEKLGLSVDFSLQEGLKNTLIPLSD